MISEVQVLVFEDQKYRYRVPGISISSNMAQTTFTVLLKSTSLPVELLILANTDETVVSNEPSLDDSKEVVKKKINREFDNLVSNFPMYGEYKFPAGLSSTEIARNHRDKDVALPISPCGCCCYRSCKF